MEFTDVIKERYSCRRFSEKQVEPEKLDQVLEAGRIAPTAKNIQPVHIYVVQSPKGLEKIDKATTCRYGAPTCLVVTFNKGAAYKYPDGKTDSAAEDASIVATHMLLAAQNAGLATCWLNRFAPAPLAKDLALPAVEEILMILDLGYASPAAAPSPMHKSRKDLQSLVSYL